MSWSRIYEGLLSYAGLSASSVLLALVLAYTFSRALEKLGRNHLPPGPPRGWIIWNTIPQAFSYRHFENWSRKYGPVFSLRQGLQTLIIINRVDAVVDIMEKEGAHLADRPRSIAAGEVLSGGMRMLLTPQGERIKKMRKAMQVYLHSKRVSTTDSLLQRLARQLVYDIIDHPEDHEEHARKYAVSVIKMLAYAEHPTQGDDPDLSELHKCMTSFSNALRPGLWKVDAFPFLQYVPRYLSELRQAHQTELKLFKRKLDEVRRKTLSEENPTTCFARFLLDHQSELGLDYDELAYLTGSMFGAGSETTAASITTVIMAAACHPQAQAAVQRELDRVVGPDRALRVSDRERLIESTAFFLEASRWRPVTAGGFPHKATKDIFWGGYVIPKGAIVYGNNWSIGRDPIYFEDPEVFNPQRWISSEGTIRDDLRSVMFGYGRRACPGQALATTSVALNTSLLLWAFNISEDPSNPIDTLAFTPGASTRPLPFAVRFQPRIPNLRLGEGLWEKCDCEEQ